MLTILVDCAAWLLFTKLCILCILCDLYILSFLVHLNFNISDTWLIFMGWWRRLYENHTTEIFIRIYQDTMYYFNDIISIIHNNIYILSENCVILIISCHSLEKQKNKICYVYLNCIAGSFEILCIQHECMLYGLCRWPFKLYYIVCLCWKTT